MLHKFGDIKFDGITRFYPLPENLVLPYKHNNVTFEFAAVEPARPYLVKYQYMLEGYDDDWNPVTNKTSATFGNIWEGTYTFKIKALFTGPGRDAMPGVSGNQWSEPVVYTFKVLPPWWRTWWMYGVYILFLVAGFWLLVKWRERKLKREKEILEKKVDVATAEIREKNVVLNQQNEEIRTQKDEITTQRDLVTKQKEHIEEIHKDLTDSIHYAQRIQSAVLPSKEYTDTLLSDYFILFKPRDIVSGDFYWLQIRKQWLFITVSDCTGHGVPGAFMSMLGVSFLNEIVAREDISTASGVLNELRNYVIKSLQQSGKDTEQKDGMDISFIALNLETSVLQYAGANNPLYIIKPDPQGHINKGSEQRDSTSHDSGDLAGRSLIEIKGDKMPVAIHPSMTPFVNHEIKVNTGDSLYLCTDGYEDQFGGPKGKKFMSKRLKQLIIDNCQLTMAEQKEIFNKTIESWINGYETRYVQTDDITVLGIRI
ncbi:MAG: SpoIIE family protein phosphatase [Bacteroidia bacterium]|nr:SpoIIE family protein phosphatase [Bacteroidia bacterium]